MAFSDLCQISNAFKAVENESDQSDRFMEENSMVQDLITKILDDTGSTEKNGPAAPSSEKPPVTTQITTVNTTPYSTSEPTTSYAPTFNGYQSNSLFNYSPNQSLQQNAFGFDLQNGFGNTNGFSNYPDGDVNLLGLDPVAEAATDTVTPEQLNLLRLAAQEIGGAQFTTPNKFDDKFYNYFEPNQRNSMPETNMFSNNFTRPTSLNVDMFGYEGYNAPRYANAYTKDPPPESADLHAYLTQLNLSIDRTRDEQPLQDFKYDMTAPYQSDEFKVQEDRAKMFYGRNYPGKFNESYYFDPPGERTDYYGKPGNTMGYKPNGFQGDFRRDGFQGNGVSEQRGFEGPREPLIRQGQDVARQMNLMMRARPPPNQLNVDVSFLHENAPFSLGLGALLGPSPPVPQTVLPSPLLDMPLTPYHTMRSLRQAASASGVLHARLDACYEQWRQLERERKRTEARLALAYPGRAVSSSNSIPVPRLPPCPTRVDRLTVDMLREHTKVLTLMGKMETLRASVCAASRRNDRQRPTEDTRITVLRRGQDNVPSPLGQPPTTSEGPHPAPEVFDPSTWREDVANMSEIAPHSEVESAMLAWRSAVAGVQAARRRELAPHGPHARHPRTDQFDWGGTTALPDILPPTSAIMHLADAVKQLGICARRARCAMWCDLTLTVALAPPHSPPPTTTATTKVIKNENSTQAPSQVPSPKQTAQENSSNSQTNKTVGDSEEDKPKADAVNSATPTSKSDAKNENNNNNSTINNNNRQTNKQPDRQLDKNQQRRSQNYRQKVNQGRNDFYQKNRYDNRFVHNRHPYHYLATGPIN